MRKFMSAVVASAMIATMAVQGFAAGITTAGGNGTVPVELTTVAPTFSVTVPTKLTVNVAANGTVTTASNAEIVNNSHGAVKVTNMTIAHAGSWVTKAYDTDMSKEKVNTKAIAMKINNDTTTGADKISFTASNFPKINGAGATDRTNKLKITYDAKLPAQTSAISAENVANVVFTVGWDTL